LSLIVTGGFVITRVVMIKVINMGTGREIAASAQKFGVDGSSISDGLENFDLILARQIWHRVFDNRDLKLERNSL